MEKNTLLAVILSVVIITVGFIVQNTLWPREAPKNAPASSAAGAAAPQVTQVPSPSAPAAAPVAAAPAVTPAGTVVPVPEDISGGLVTLENDVFKAVFSTKGAILRSLKLKQHKDKNDLVELINRGNSESGAFEFFFGKPGTKPVDADFRVRRPDANTIEFSRDFEISGYQDSSFRLVKSFSMRPREYMLQVEVNLENPRNQYLPLNFDGSAYTLGFGPQVGPTFDKLDGRYEYRSFYAYGDGKIKHIEIKDNKDTLLDKKALWFGVTGKYFTVLAAPVFSDYSVLFSTRPVEGLTQSSFFFITRPVVKSARNTDIYRFYMGPKLAEDLDRYNDETKNAFGLKDMHFSEIMDSNFFLGWLEFLLKALMRFFYGLIPNWGVAIILVTVVVKIITFPLTQKSYKSTSRMQSLGPKIAELKEKYKGNQAKMNQEMAAIYKKEGINPMSGCLPMLLQIPIFFAMYGLFNSHFDLRGAAFVGWVNDLSAPDSILNFAPVTIPFLGWSDLRLLPILFVGTQLITSKMMQTPGAISNMQLKMMTYGLPIVFFFILYDVPSGLLVYWIVQNILSVAQQYLISRKRKLTQGVKV